MPLIQIVTWWWCWMKSQRIIEVITIHEEDMNVYNKFSCNPSNSSWDISLKSTNVSLMVVLEESHQIIDVSAIDPLGTMNVSVQTFMPVHPIVIDKASLLIDKVKFFWINCLVYKNCGKACHKESPRWHLLLYLFYLTNNKSQNTFNYKIVVD